jgi:hypothetical protein
VVDFGIPFRESGGNGNAALDFFIFASAEYSSPLKIVLAAGAGKLCVYLYRTA